VIFADVLNDHGHLDEIRRLTAGNREAGLLVDQMIARKRALFADDERLIGDWEITRTPEGINVRATRETRILCHGILHLAAARDQFASGLPPKRLRRLTLVQNLRKHSRQVMAGTNTK
jgi:hypothetical protein